MPPDSGHASLCRFNTDPNGTKANAAGISGNARASRKQSKRGVIREERAIGMCCYCTLSGPTNRKARVRDF